MTVGISLGPALTRFLFVLPNFEMQHTIGNVMYIYVHIFMHACMHSYIYPYILTHTFTHTHIYTYICTYMHTYIHTYIYTYIHTYKQIACCLGPVQGQNRNFLKRHSAYAVPPVFIQFLHHIDKYIILQPEGMVANKIT